MKTETLTAEQVAEMERQLAAHYGEPVRPVSRYCDALAAWARAAVASDDQASRDAAEHLLQASLQIMKSNLLWRLIYDGQQIRTEKCPEHQGRWSGCRPEPCPHGCSDHSNVTGWLPLPRREELTSGDGGHDG